MWRPWRSCWWSPPPAFLHPRLTKRHGRLDRSFGYFCHFSLFDRFMQYFFNPFCQFAFFQDCHRTDAPLVSSSLVVLELTPGWPQESWASFHPAAARHYPDSTSAWAWSKLVSDVTIWGLGGDEDVRHICAEYVALFLSAEARRWWGGGMTRYLATCTPGSPRTGQRRVSTLICCQLSSKCTCTILSTGHGF